ncbi:MAG TPA: MFS transporter [Acidimicrobiia bacterium]
MSDQVPAPFIPPRPDEQPIESATFGVLRGPFFRLFAAQFSSSLGDWIGLLAILALAQSVSGGTGIGLVMIARMLPGFVLAPVGGALIDRWDRRKVMVTCDIGRAVLLALLPFFHNLVELVLISFLIEILTLMWSPAKDASVPNVVESDQLASANSLGLVAAYATFPLGAALFAALAGISKWLGHFHALHVFHANQSSLAIWVDGASFLISAWLIAHLALPEEDRHTPRRIDWGATYRDIVEGVRFIRTDPLVRGVMIGLAGGLLGGGAVIPLGPLLSKQVLGGGDGGFGLLITALGVGAAIGVLTLLWLQRRLPRATVFTVAIVACGASIIVAASVSSLTPAMFAAAAVGATAGTGYVTGFTVLQENVADEMRGRIFATLYTVVRLCLLLSLTLSPFIANLLANIAKHLTNGSVHFGALRIDLPGVRLALWLGGVVTILSGLFARFLMRRVQHTSAVDGSPA